MRPIFRMSPKAGDSDDERREDKWNNDHQQHTQKELPDRLGDIRDHPLHARVVAAEQSIGKKAGADADTEADQDSRVKRQASWLVGSLVVEIGRRFSFEIIGRGIEAFVIWIVRLHRA